MSAAAKISTAIPKRKSDLVEAIVEVSSMTPAVLNEMTVEKLKVIYRSVRAAKPPSVLPANWKRFSKNELLMLYCEKVIPYYGLEKDKRHLEWGRDRMIVELCNFVEDYKEETGGQYAIDQEVSQFPKCPKCQVGMVERVNRTTGERFLGCLAFPACRQTMHMEYAEVKSQKNRATGSIRGVKMTELADLEEMEGDTRRRAVRTPVPPDSEISWDQVTDAGQGRAMSVMVSPQELEMLKKLREGDLS